jgi:putative peptidoglycan lipid II flippase
LAILVVDLGNSRDQPGSSGDVAGICANVKCVNLLARAGCATRAGGRAHRRKRASKTTLSQSDWALLFCDAHAHCDLATQSILPIQGSANLAANIKTSSLLVVLITAASAAAGYVREMIVAALYGAGPTIDAFFFSLALVQTLHDIVFIGILSATVIPLLTHEAQAKAAAKAEFVLVATWTTGLGAALIAAIVRLFLPAIFEALRPHLSGLDHSLTLTFANMLIWLLPANALLTLFSFVLTSERKFFLAAVPFLGNHVLFVAALTTLGSIMGERALPAACFAGPIVILPIIILQLMKSRLLLSLWPHLSARLFKLAWHMSWPSLLSAGLGSSIGLVTASHLILRSFAAGEGQGAIAALGYAYKLYEVPLSLIVNPTAMIVFPVLATMYVNGQTAQFAALSRKVLTWGLIILFPIAVISFAGADVIVDLLLRRGRFDAADARATADALRGFAPAILFEAGIIIMFRIYYASRKPAIPVAVTILTLVSLIGLTQISAGHAFIDFPSALPLALSAAFALAALVLMGSLEGTFGSHVLPGAATLAGWAASAIIALGIGRWVEPAGAHGLSMVFPIAAFLATYMILAALLLPDCRKAIADAIKRRTIVAMDDAGL